MKLSQWKNFKFLGLPCFVFIFKSFGPVLVEKRKSAALPEGLADGSQAAAAGEESMPATEFITVESARASGTCHELQSDFQHIKFLYVEEDMLLLAELC